MEEITLEWFFKMPGILIVGGVILIILAIIIFAVSGSKNKNIKEKNETMEKPIDVSPVKISNSSLDSKIVANNDILKPETKIEDKKDDIVELSAKTIPTIVESVVKPVVESNSNTAPTILEPIVTPIIEPIVNTNSSVVQPTTNITDTSKIDIDNVQMIVPSTNDEPEEII